MLPVISLFGIARTLSAIGEKCEGANNAANPYGTGKCTTACIIGPYCGDGRIQTAFGEKCDGTVSIAPGTLFD